MVASLHLDKGIHGNIAMYLDLSALTYGAKTAEQTYLNSLVIHHSTLIISISYEDIFTISLMNCINIGLI